MIVLKDNIVFVGVLCINGILMLDWILKVDVMVVICVMDVGGVIVGKVGEDLIIEFEM